MSSPIQPVRHVRPVGHARARASAAKRSASTRSPGSSSRQPERSAFSSTRRASSTPSSSTSESPVGRPIARKKLKHIAPPIRIASATSRKRSITPILSLTLAPPRITTNGCSGSASSEDEHRHLLLQQEARDRRPQAPRHALGRRVRAVRGAERVVHVEVGRAARARPRAPGRSWSRPARSGCSRAPSTSPAARVRARCSISGPTTAGAWRTGQPVSSASRRDDRRHRERAGRGPWAGPGATRPRASRLVVAQLARASAARRGCARRPRPCAPRPRPRAAR